MSTDRTPDAWRSTQAVLLCCSELGPAIQTLNQSSNLNMDSPKQGCLGHTLANVHRYFSLKPTPDPVQADDPDHRGQHWRVWEVEEPWASSDGRQSGQTPQDEPPAAATDTNRDPSHCCCSADRCGSSVCWARKRLRQSAQGKDGFRNGPDWAPDLPKHFHLLKSSIRLPVLTSC